MATENTEMIDVAKTAVAAKDDRLITEFETFTQTATAENPAWMNQIRKAAISHFAELGFPTTRHEEWKYTNVAPIAKLPLRPITRNEVEVSREQIQPFIYGDAHRLVFVNGHFAPELSSLGEGIRAISLAEATANNQPELEKHLARYAPYDENPFTALNTAFFQDGALIVVPAGTTLSKPIHILFVAAGLQAGDAIHVRNLILGGKSCEATVIESYASLVDAPYITNAVTEIVVEPNGHIEHLKVQNESQQAYHIATVQAHQTRDSRCTSHSISLGAKLARNDIRIKLDDEGCEGTLNGLYLGKDDQLVDHHTVVDHAKPRCESHEFYHGILDDRSQGIFNGKIFVRQDAQKTNAKQTSRGLLLSETASLNTKPQLEIFADDVKCTHGATVGQLDDTALFYLRSRGIPHDTARRMLIYAFASDVVNRVGVEAVRAELEKVLHERFD